MVVPYVLDAAGGYRVEASGKAPRPGNADVFVLVPKGTQAFNAGAKFKGCRGALEIMDPAGNYPTRIAGAFPHNENVFEPVKDGEIQRSFDGPLPGVWQISVANRGDSFFSYDDKAPDPLQPCDFSVSASALGADLQPAAKSVKAGQAYTAQIANRLATFNSRIASAGLGSARISKPTFNSELQQVIYELNVPKGTTRLEAVIDGASDPEADVDLYLFDSTGELPYLAAYGVNDDSQKRAEVLDPKPGKWQVVLDPYHLPHGSTQINYRDTFYHDAFGNIEVSAQKSGVAKIKTDPTSFSIQLRARPEGERVLVGAIDVVSDDVYVTIVDPDAKVPEPNPTELPKPVPTKNILIPIQTLVFSVE